MLTFVDKVPDYEIREGNMHITTGDWSCCMSLRTFRLAMARAQKAIAAYEAERAIIPIKGKRGHAAS